MADAARNITIKVLLDEAKARMGLKQLGDDAEKSGSRWSKMGATAKAGIALAGAALVSFAVDAVKAAAADEAAQRQLALALENTTGATEAQVGAVEDYIKQTSLASGVTDDELRPAMANLVRATKDVEEAQDLMGVAMDIATAKGIPLETVTKGIAKAVDGNVGALGRMGIKVKDATGKMLTFEEAMAEASETMGGATAAAADTAEGKMRRMGVAVEEAKESIGASLLPAMEAALPVIQDLGKAAGLTGIEFQQWTGKISDVDAAIQTFELHMGDTADTAQDALTIWKTSGVEFGELLDELKLAPSELGKLDRATDTYLHTLGMTDEMIVQYRDNVARAKAVSIDSRGEQTRAKFSQQELGDAYEDTTGAIRDQIAAEREKTDPLFRLLEATDKATEAQQKYNLAVSKEGAHSAAAEDAALDLVRAHQDASDAAAIFAEEGGQASIDAFKTMAREAGLDEAAINRVINAMKRANQTPFNPRRARENEDQTSSYQPGRQFGGPVSKGKAYTVGEAGPETFIPATSGRIARHGGSGGGTGSVNNITINAGLGSDPNAISKAVVEALKRYDRSTGPIPIRIRP